MAYELHIDREDGFISLEEWEQAVIVIENVRLSSGHITRKNPNTGEDVSCGLPKGSAEVLFEDGTWNFVFWFSGGEAQFRAPDEMNNPNAPVRSVASALAKRLSARIVGDEGETYEW